MENHPLKIASLNSELLKLEKLEEMEKADILLINDKYSSKIVLTYFAHERPPNTLVNLDLTEHHSSIEKRLNFIKVKNSGKSGEILCHFLLQKETTNFKAL